METLKYGDIVIFKVKGTEFKYKVTNDHLFLQNSDFGIYHSNEAIFNILELDKYEFASKMYGYKASCGLWPPFRNGDYKAATRLVEQLQILCDSKESLGSKYKVGDKVIIAKRDGDGSDYPFTFVNDMANLAGEEYIIESVTSVCSDSHRVKKYYEEPFKYQLKGLGFTWASSMFKPAETSLNKINILNSDLDDLDDFDDFDDLVKDLSESKTSTLKIKKAFKINNTEREITLKLKSTNKYHF